VNGARALVQLTVTNTSDTDIGKKILARMATISFRHQQFDNIFAD